MSLAHGRHYLAIPGPSVIPDRVLGAMHQPAPNIYTGDLVEMVDGMVPDLCRVARTDGKVAIYISNGHGVWEAALANVVTPGEKVLVLATGRFAEGWGVVAASLGIEVEVLDFGQQAPVDPAQVEARLRAYGAWTIRAVLVAQTDTATSALSDIAAIRAAMDAACHPALLMVDCIASLACDRFEMDLWGADVMVAGCQKGLMTPPGLGFVFFNDKAAARRSAMSRVSAYWDWVPRTEAGMFYQLFSGTAPTHHLFGLREALTMILEEEGLEAVWARHQVLADAIRAACRAWGAGGPLRLNMVDLAASSNAVTALHIGAPHGTRLRDWLSAHAGVTLGIGLSTGDDDPEGHGLFRIGHMGHVNAHMVLGMLGTIEAGMRALKIPFGDGALSAAAAVCAGQDQ
ncbi:MAG: pyridoxal-phosphate-dependent aminotransferase family protein [Qingshengfaniella sp.]